MRTVLAAVLCMASGAAWACDDQAAKPPLPRLKYTIAGGIVGPVIEVPKPVATDEKPGPTQ